MSTHPARSLSRVLEDFGHTLLDLLCGDPDAAGEIGGVGIHDPYDEQHHPEHAIVLGVGVHGAEETARLLRYLAALGATVLVVRGPVDDADELEPVVNETGVALLALTRGASWAQLAAMLRTQLAEGDVGEGEEQTLGGVPSGDLFALANAIATLLDAPVTIEDRRSRVLACSVINIKPARVGGYLEARRIHDVARAHGVPVWCGGMLETGIGRAANVALAALPGFTLPGDTSGSHRYFATDVTDPFVLSDGHLDVPTGPGLGTEPLPDVLKEVTTSTERIAL